MVQSSRIEISGQMGMCDTSEVTVSRSMPAVMEGRMNNFAWISFCDKMDEALEPVAKAKKIMVVGMGVTMGVSLLLVIVGFVTFGALASKSVSSFGNSANPVIGMIPFGLGMLLMILGTVGSSCYAASKSGEARNKMKKVCEETSALHQGISFHIRDEMRFMGYRGGSYNNGYNNNGYNTGGYRSNNVDVLNTNYIEVYVAEAGEATPAQGYFGPVSTIPTAPVLAVVEEANTNAKTPEERMRELQKMKGMLTEDEYQAKRAEILSDV